MYSLNTEKASEREKQYKTRLYARHTTVGNNNEKEEEDDDEQLLVVELYMQIGAVFAHLFVIKVISLSPVKCTKIYRG